MVAHLNYTDTRPSTRHISSRSERLRDTVVRHRGGRCSLYAVEQ